MPVQEDRINARRRLRAARRKLGPAERGVAARRVAANLARAGLPRPRSRVAFYLPMDGELDTGPAMAHARRLGCEIYVPVITGFSARRMRFAPLAAVPATQPNRWGIHEPEGIGINGRWLDLVLVPCVAFDGHGGRLGLGAGFYDRHFHFLASRRAWRRPWLVGLAYDFQRIERLETAPWDVVLRGVISDSAIYLPVAPGNARAAPEPP